MSGKCRTHHTGKPQGHSHLKRQKKLRIANRRTSQKKRRNANTHMMHRNNPRKSRYKQASTPISPSVSSHEQRHQDTKRKRQEEIVLALPHYDLILREVAYVGPARWDPWLDTHPTDMRPPKPAWGTIRVKFRVGIPMLFVRICAYMRPCRDEDNVLFTAVRIYR